MSALHQTAGGDERPGNEHPMNYYEAAFHALAAVRGRLAPNRDDKTDAAYFIADLRQQGFDVRAFVGGSLADPARDATARALVAMRGKTEAAGDARAMVRELRALGFDVRNTGGVTRTCHGTRSLHPARHPGADPDRGRRGPWLPAAVRNPR